MPRRNRNAHALRIDADELAAQADQLTAELTATSAVLVIDEFPLYPQLSGITGAGKPTLLRDCITTFIREHPGRQLCPAEAKAVASHAS